MSAPSEGFALPRAAELVVFAFCVANVVYLAASLVFGSWLVGSDGYPIATDFANVWAGGQHVLNGDPSAAYDITRHKAAEVEALGRSFDGEYPWLYPPTFFFVAAALAMLPYIAAQSLWLALTFPLYIAAIHRIVGDRKGILLACAFPGIVANFMVGQNGFLTAALIGGMLLLLDRRPLLAGVLLGLLSFKPHLGILFPLVLLAAGYGRVVLSAAVTTVALMAASWLAFGSAPWIEFFQGLSTASQVSLSEGRADWAKLQSLFGLVRTLGGGEPLAWGLQAAWSGATVAIVCATWRSRLSFNLKAAALVTGALVVSPYIFIYDLVVLAVAMAFLLREMQSTGYRAGDLAALGAAALLVMIFPLAMAPVGFLAVVIVGSLITRRAIRIRSPQRAPAAEPAARSAARS
jgi:hypothetical protein